MARYSGFMKEKPSNSSWSRFMMTSWSGGVRTGGWRVKKRSKFSASRPHCRRERRTREACNGWGDDEHGHKRQKQKVKERTNKSMGMDVNVRGVTGTAGYWIAILDTYPVKQTSIMNVPTRLLCLPPKNEKSVIIYHSCHSKTVFLKNILLWITHSKKVLQVVYTTYSSIFQEFEATRSYDS